MSEFSRPAEAYLAHLGEALEVLGPKEASETVDEIRGHIGEALAEAGPGSDPDAVLAGFGSADVMATRILEERGVLTGTPNIARAPSWARLLALLADVAVWLLGSLYVMAAMGLALAPPATIHVGGLGTTELWAGQVPMLVRVLLLAAAVAYVAWSAWWWTRGRSRAGSSSTGMRLMGLRRIRAGAEVRTVRAADIPGAVRPNRLLQVALVALAVCLVTPVAWSQYANAKDQRFRELVSAGRSTSEGMGQVSELYSQVMDGATLDNLSGSYAESATAGVRALIQRRTRGRLSRYSLSSAELLEYRTSDNVVGTPRAGEVTEDIAVRVRVFEEGKSDDDEAAYLVDARLRMIADAPQTGGSIFSSTSSSGGSWLIESIERDPEQ